MINLIIQLIGFILLWFATDVGREDESKISIFSREWWIILVLIVIGTQLIIHTH